MIGGRQNSGALQRVGGPSVLFLLALSVVALGLSGCNKDLPPRSDPSYAECKAERDAAACHGNCKDGFGEDLYYDRKSVKLDSTELHVLAFADSTRRKSLCSYFSRVCKPCGQVYRLRGVQVTCSEFHAYLKQLKVDTSIRLDTAYAGF